MFAVVAAVVAAFVARAVVVALAVLALLLLLLLLSLTWLIYHLACWAIVTVIYSCLPIAGHTQ